MTWAAVLFGLAAAVVLMPFIAEVRRARMGPAARTEAAPGQMAKSLRGDIHYRWHLPDRGAEEAPVAVCIHGLTTPSFVWDAFARELALRGWRVLTYDLYGRGFSDRPAGAQNRRFFLRQLDALLEHEGVTGPFTLVGYSMGGAIATCWAAEHPERLDRLVLVAPAGMGHFPTGLLLAARDLPLVGDWMMRAFFPPMHRRAARALVENEGADPSVGAAQAAQLDWRGFVPAVLASLRGILADTQEAEHRRIARQGPPVLAIWGARDTAIPLDCMGVLARWNRTATHVQIDDATHWLPITHPEELADAFHDAVG